MFRLNPEYWGNCIAVPRSLPEKHLKLASGASFKVLLYLLSSDGDSLSDISRGTGLSEADAADAISYWVKHGVLLDSAQTQVPKAESIADIAQPEAKKNDEPAAPAKKRLSTRPLPTKYPTHAEIAKRTQASEELSLMYSEAQGILGTAFGYNTQSLLLMMYDHYGFSAEVILMLLQHAKLTGKSNGEALKALAKDWADNGVHTLSDAERVIETDEKILAAYTQLAAECSLDTPTPTDAQKKRMYTWMCTYGYGTDVIACALKKAEQDGAKGSFVTAGKDIAKWHSKGLGDMDAITRYCSPRADKKKKSPVKLRERTYDLSRTGRERYYEEIRKELEQEGEDNA